MVQTPVFQPADILLPDFNMIDPEKWSCIACDQFTSEPDYWEEAEKTAGSQPSALNLVLPEVYLDDSDRRIPMIHGTMRKYLNENVFKSYPGSMIYVERTQSDGKIRHGLVGAVDLEQYDYNKGSLSLIRPTEGTVLERIPPRVKVRVNAPLELPHVMLLVDDPEDGFLTCARNHRAELLYDFELMLGGGHIRGWLVSKEAFPLLDRYSSHLTDPSTIREKYGSDLPPLLFAVGDGNHSLATAKATYEKIKEELGKEQAQNHPARYALCEINNLHDKALSFEPIYRVVYGADAKDLFREFEDFCDWVRGSAPFQEFTCLYEEKKFSVTAPHPAHQLAVGTVQAFLDSYLKEHEETVRIDYVHDLESVEKLVSEGAAAFVFEGMKKNELFRSVMMDGVLPRKTFSMGHARDKRYYLESRMIVPNR